MFFGKKVRINPLRNFKSESRAIIQNDLQKNFLIIALTIDV